MRKLLIVVDYQNDFVRGSLGFKKAESLEFRIAEKIKRYRKNGDEIVFTLDTHNNAYLETQEGRNLPVIHCIEGTDGWKLYGSIGDLKESSDKCFMKNSFGSSELFSYLLDGSYESIEIAGVVTNLCVISNAILAKTALPEVPVFVDADCVASNDDALNQEALDIMKSMQIAVLNAEA